MQRESMQFDVLIVGGGPAGLAAAIRLKQQAQSTGKELSVCLIEKGAEIGAHILSGAVIDPRALNELFPDWLQQGAPLDTPVTEDHLLYLNHQHTYKVPNFLLPACLKNRGNYIISLAKLCRWLSEQAEALGVEIYPGFTANEILFTQDNAVEGVITGDMGRRKDGQEGQNFAPGMALHAKYTLFAEGCRGHLGKQLQTHYQLNAHNDPQVYAIGLKELWEIPAAQHQAGSVIHTIGWPLDKQTYGGGFVYHLGQQQISIGYVVGLNYRNPYLSPYEEFQRFKTHPSIRSILNGGRRLAYGARAISAGGLQSLPKLVFPGGALIGDDAGFLNASRIKGSHCAIKSGSLAAEACFAALQEGRSLDELFAFPQAFRKSWLYDELYRARNFKPWINKGLALGSLMFGIDQHLLRGKAPWTLHHSGPDHQQLDKASTHTPITYPPPDNIITFDRLSAVALSNTHHENDQPCHLHLKNAETPIAINLHEYAAPEQRYCPAGVYEIIYDATENPRLQINASNCIHCKTCDIKDPTQNIEWRAPQGGEGPNYPGL